MREARGLFHFAPVVKFSFVLVCLNNKLCNHLYVACFQVYISGDLARGAHSMHSPHRRHTAQSAASTASTTPSTALATPRSSSSDSVHSQYTRSTLAVHREFPHCNINTRVENFSTGLCNAATTHENSARTFSRLNLCSLLEPATRGYSRLKLALLAQPARSAETGAGGARNSRKLAETVPRLQVRPLRLGFA